MAMPAIKTVIASFDCAIMSSCHVSPPPMHLSWFKYYLKDFNTRKNKILNGFNIKPKENSKFDWCMKSGGSTLFEMEVTREKEAKYQLAYDGNFK
jgi:hypothetical protein